MDDILARDAEQEEPATEQAKSSSSIDANIAPTAQDAQDTQPENAFDDPDKTVPSPQSPFSRSASPPAAVGSATEG